MIETALIVIDTLIIAFGYGCAVWGLIFVTEDYQHCTSIKKEHIELFLKGATTAGAGIIWRYFL